MVRPLGQNRVVKILGGGMFRKAMPMAPSHMCPKRQTIISHERYDAHPYISALDGGGPFSFGLC